MSDTDHHSENSPVSVRNEHIAAEENLKMVGTLLILWAAASLTRGVLEMRISPELRDPTEFIVFYLFAALAYLFAGLALRRLQVAGRYLASIPLVLGLFMTGDLWGSLETILTDALLPAMVLFVLWNPKSGVVLSKRYRDEVIPASEGVQGRGNFIWVILALFAFLVLHFVFTLDEEV